MWPADMIPLKGLGASKERASPLLCAVANLPSAQKSGYPFGYPLFWSCWADSNCRPHPYQGCALPTELQQQSTCPLLGACVATEKGLEPSTSGVTGRRSNRLNHSATAQLIYQKNRDLSTLFFRMVIFSSEEVFGSGKKGGGDGAEQGAGAPGFPACHGFAQRRISPPAHGCLFRELRYTRPRHRDPSSASPPQDDRTGTSFTPVCRRAMLGATGQLLPPAASRGTAAATFPRWGKARAALRVPRRA